ncbi:MAG: PQQ-binding-like beta-propeller repeat protein [Bacteroidales bacterium]|nr:PQQ-binding-like beta-propeller repeat protein [Bacteroidales bacterium]
MRYPVLIIFFFIIICDISGQSGENEWPLFRGKPDLAGKSVSELPVSPALLWTISTGARTKSSPVVSNETIYFGNEKGNPVCSHH